MNNAHSHGEEDLQALIHDMKNIIMGANGHISLLRSGKNCEPGMAESLQKVEGMLMEAGYLARSVLSRSGERDARSEERLSTVDLVETTASVCIVQLNVRFECKWRGPIPLLTGDALPLKRVLRDLFTNAVEELESGGEIHVTLFPVESPKDIPGLHPDAPAYIGIEVKDSGKGVPTSLRDKIFDKGFTTRSWGSGMGLYSAKERVEQMGGVFELVEGEGPGAVFRILLPATKDMDPHTLGDCEVKPKSALQRVLLLDDDLMILQIVARMLEHIGVEVSLTSTPAEALQSFEDACSEDREFDLMIVDLNLGDKVGGETIVRQIRQIRPEAYIIVTSGWDRDPRIQQFRDYGFSACLRKPFTLEDLRSALEQSARKH